MGELYLPLRKNHIQQNPKYYLQDKIISLQKWQYPSLVPNVKSVSKGETDIVPQNNM